MSVFDFQHSNSIQISMDEMYKKEFVFQTDRYEEWDGGLCLSRGNFSTQISCKISPNKIYFEIDETGDLKTVRSFSLDLEGSYILKDRIQYIKDTGIRNPTEPSICHLFFDNNTLSYVRFAYPSPSGYRIIEFYGTLTNVSHPSLSKDLSIDKELSISSVSIIHELKEMGCLDSGTMLEKASRLYNLYEGFSTVEDAFNFVEVLKLFIKANQLEDLENEDSVTVLKPKILMFIALCNFKINNFKSAYLIAKKGLRLLDVALENSSITGIPRNTLGADTLEKIINVIDESDLDLQIGINEYDKVDPNVLDITYLESILQ